MIANHSADHAQRERTHLCSELEMRSHLRQERYARSWQEIEELKRRCYQEETQQNNASWKNSIRSRIRIQYEIRFQGYKNDQNLSKIQ